MDVLTRSSSLRRSSPLAGPAALALGVVAVLALPAAIAVAQVSARVTLLQAAAAIPVAAAAGMAAIVLGRRAARSVRSLRPGGGAVSTAARLLGLLGLCLAITASISVGFYELLVHFQ